MKLVVAGLFLLQPHGDATALMRPLACANHHIPAASLLLRRHALLRRCAAPSMAEPEEEAAAAAEEASAKTFGQELLGDKAAASDKEAKKAEKQKLKNTIANLELQLKDARGELLEAEDAARDAGEKGYLLLAANFERYRQQGHVGEECDEVRPQTASF